MQYNDKDKSCPFEYAISTCWDCRASRCPNITVGIAPRLLYLLLDHWEISKVYARLKYHEKNIGEYSNFSCQFQDINLWCIRHPSLSYQLDKSLDEPYDKTPNNCPMMVTKVRNEKRF